MPAQYEIHFRSFILSPDLYEDPTFTLDSYDLSTFATWEFHPRATVDFFNRERTVGLDEEEDEDDDDEDVVLGITKEEEELLPLNLTEDEAIEMAIGNSELDELS
jgi:hypothetical protein